MIDFLMQYALFFAKTLTLVIAFIVVIATLFALSHKGKGEEGLLCITNINKKLANIRHSLQVEALPKAQLKKWLKSEKQALKTKKKADSDEDATSSRLFVIRFEGDIRASQVKQLRESISAIIEIALPADEVLVVLDSPGGLVNSYGLAASQLQRLREKNIFLTMAIDKCAASGGYMMACVGNKIIAAPFSIIGSIGVIAQIPNFHRLLEKNNIDFEMITAGEYKRTLTLFGENTEKGRQKLQEEVEETHHLFKQFITENRPQVNIAEVATGEHWYAIDALKFKLIDELQTSDSFILEKAKNTAVYELSYKEKEKLSKKIAHSITHSFESILLMLKKITLPKWF